MKKFSIYAVLLLLVTLTVMSACNKDSEDNVITVQDATSTDNGQEFVGTWYGRGPYRASGTSYDKFNLVNGTWKFLSDGTYSWSGKNSSGYVYSERGKWHYNVENKMLITDGNCNVIWTINEFSTNQWIGTLMGTVTGTYTYTRQTEE